MRALLVAVIACLFLSVDSRPSSFESDLLSADHDGIFRKTANLQRRGELEDDDLLEYEVRYHKDVVRLDQEHRQIESIRCFSNNLLILTLAPDTKTPTFEKGNILVGGKEWGCQEQDGTPQRFAVRVEDSSRDGHIMMISTTIVTEKEVFDTLRIGWKTPKNHQPVEKRELQTKTWDKWVSWNYDKEKNAAQGPLSLLSLSCKNPEIKNNPLYKVVCGAAGISFEVLSLKCTNCWASFDLDIIFAYDKDDHTKDLIVSGTSVMNIDLTIATEIKYASTLPALLTASAPLLSFGVPGVADIGLQFIVTLDFNVSLTAIGSMTSGVNMVSNFTTVAGTHGQHDSDNNLAFAATPNKFKFEIKGDGSVKTTLRAGPHFRVSLFVTAFFDAYAEVAPYISLAFKYNLLTMPPTAAPNPKSQFKAPWMLSACASRHFVEWDYSVGAGINLVVEGIIIPQKYSKTLFPRNWSLASGCLFPINVTRPMEMNQKVILPQ